MQKIEYALFLYSIYAMKPPTPQKKKKTPNGLSYTNDLINTWWRMRDRERIITNLRVVGCWPRIAEEIRGRT
jgi:hypothetical protein